MPKTLEPSKEALRLFDSDLRGQVARALHECIARALKDPRSSKGAVVSELPLNSPAMDAAVRNIMFYAAFRPSVIREDREMLATFLRIVQARESLLFVMLASVSEKALQDLVAFANEATFAEVGREAKTSGHAVALEIAKLFTALGLTVGGGGAYPRAVNEVFSVAFSAADNANACAVWASKRKEVIKASLEAIGRPKN